MSVHEPNMLTCGDLKYNNNNNNVPCPPFYSIPSPALDTRPVRAEIERFDPLDISRVRDETSLNLYPLDIDIEGWMPNIKCAHCILGRRMGWRADRPARALNPGITRVRTHDLSVMNRIATTLRHVFNVPPLPCLQCDAVAGI